MSTKPCPCSHEMAEAQAALPAHGVAPDRVITLVHGTFARHAPWMREGPLFDALQALPGSTVFSRFCWSGANAHTDRLRAGDGLAGHLRGLARCQTTAQHFVIGHSHGGNVMLYALKDAEAAARVAGVVTMATPFLSVRRRRLHPLVLWGIWTVFLLGFVEAVLHFMAPAAERYPLSLSIAVLALLWAGGVALSALLYRGREFGWRQLVRLLLRRSDAEDIVGAELERLKLVREGGQAARLQLERMLVARPFGDEASMSLVVSQFLGWAQNHILTLAASLAGSFWKPGWFAWTWKLVLMGFMVVLATQVLPHTLSLLQWEADQSVLQPVLEPLLGDWAFVGAGLVVVIASLMMAVMILFGLLALLCMLVLMAAGLPFGPDAMFWNLYASITAESSPPGSARVFLQSPPPTQAGAGLVHSGVYTDPVVIREIVGWIIARGAR